MKSVVTKAHVKKLLGQNVHALKKDGTVVSGKLVRVKGNEIVVAVPKGKNVKTSAFIPLVLFDLLAIETVPFGGFGGPFFGPFGGFGPGFGGFDPFWF